MLEDVEDRVRGLITDYVGWWNAVVEAGQQPVWNGVEDYKTAKAKCDLKYNEIELALGFIDADEYAFLKDNFENKLYLMTEEQVTQFYTDKVDREHNESYMIHAPVAV